MTLVRRKENIFPDLWNNFFENEWFSNNQLMATESRPAVNIKETDKGYDLEMALPGVKKDQINIDVEKDRMTISAANTQQNEKQEDGKFTRKEFSYQSFSRSFTLPENINRESIEAKHEDGILRIVLPKLLEKQNLINRIKIQ